MSELLKLLAPDDSLLANNRNDVSSRILQDAYGGSGGHNNNNNANGEFNCVTFWVINATVIVLVISIVIWCRRFGGSETVIQFVQRITDPAASDREYAQNLAERRRMEEERKKETPEQRKHKLLDSFQRNQVKMVVKENDFVDSAAASTASNTDNSNEDEPANDIETGSPLENADNNNIDGDAADGDIETGGTTVPLPGKNEDTVTTTLEDGDQDDTNISLALRSADIINGSIKRHVPNCCAVCLCPYEVGETVVWSANDKCQHVFHEECIMDWFIKMQNGTPCPCCRQEFTDLAKVEKKKQALREMVHPRQFDLRHVSL